MGQITPFQKYALALDPRSKDLLSVSPEVRTEIWSELEEKTVHHHEGQEQKRLCLTKTYHMTLCLVFQ